MLNPLHRRSRKGFALCVEHQSARMSKIKNGRLDQYDATPFEQQQFGTAGVEGVNQGGTNRNRCSQRLVILHVQTYQ